jgi:hypothetical protein
MQPVFISSSDKGSDKIRLGDRYEQNQTGRSLRAFFERFAPQAGDCHAARRALAARNDNRPSKESDLLSEGQYLYLAFSLEIAIL